jgi:hypothetical protein
MKCVCELNDITKYQCFRQFVFELLNLRMETFQKILRLHPKIITRALMCTPSVYLEKLKIIKPIFFSINRKKSLTS